MGATSPASWCRATSTPCIPEHARPADPLPFRRDGNKVYGSRAYDMKGGLVLTVEAFRQLAGDRIASPPPLTFMFNPDKNTRSG